MSFEKEKGAILIITLWILAILTILSVGVAGRMGLELKLTGFYRDNMKALYLAKAGINRAITEKEENDVVADADLLNESWANNKDLFDNHKINETENSSFTIKYTYKENITEGGTELYGIMDEASKININKIVKTDDSVDVGIKQQLLWLLENICDISMTEATYKVNALIDWIDVNPAPQEPGSDTEDYTDIYPGFEPKKRLESIEELLLIKGFDSTILYGNVEQEKHGIIDYITIYPEDGKININTAPKEVLQALGFTLSQAVDISNYRKNGGEVGDPENQPITKLTDLTDGTIPYTESLTTDDINNITNNIIPYLSTTTKTFRIYAKGKVNKVEKPVVCVVIIESDKNPIFKFWNEQ